MSPFLSTTLAYQDRFTYTGTTFANTGRSEKCEYVKARVSFYLQTANETSPIQIFPPSSSIIGLFLRTLKKFLLAFAKYWRNESVLERLLMYSQWTDRLIPHLVSLIQLLLPIDIPRPTLHSFISSSTNYFPSACQTGHPGFVSFIQYFCFFNLKKNYLSSFNVLHMKDVGLQVEGKKLMQVEKKFCLLSANWGRHARLVLSKTVTFSKQPCITCSKVCKSISHTHSYQDEVPRPCTYTAY